MPLNKETKPNLTGATTAFQSEHHCHRQDTLLVMLHQPVIFNISSFFIRYVVIEINYKWPKWRQFTESSQSSSPLYERG